MKGCCEKAVASKYSSKSSTDPLDQSLTSICSEERSYINKSSKAYSWSGFFASIFEPQSELSSCEKKTVHSKHNGWTINLKKIMMSGSMRRLQERIMGSSSTGICSSTSDMWLLGVCYKMSQDEAGEIESTGNGLIAFEEDFSSRILMTYRKGFDAIRDSKYTTDVNWGCMLRSSQMLVAQALLFHKLGRSWRKCAHKLLNEQYVEILQLFGDSEASAFSIHNLIQAGKIYDLAPGSWVGPYAVCRSWETLVHHNWESADLQDQFPMALYIVSGDADGERGGAPVVCIDNASKHCLEFSRGQLDWTPILLLVPLVLGLEKINPRYIPLLRETFMFPQSLGIIGGKPGASTYIVGVQDEKVFYLDPHEVQTVIHIGRNDLEADTSSYESSIVRYIPLESIDPSLAIGFYCRDKDGFDDFCRRASTLADKSNGAPLFTVAAHGHNPKLVSCSDVLVDDDSCDVEEAEVTEEEGSLSNQLQIPLEPIEPQNF